MKCPRRVAVKRVIILVQPEEDKLKFRIVVPAWATSACSSVMTVDSGPAGWDGNPYCLYGDDVAEYVGCSKYDVSIDVCLFTDGKL